MGKGGKLIHSNAQVITLLTLVIQFLHCLLCLANYLDWVRHQRDNPDIGVKIVRLYLALTVIAIISYLMVSSVFYMWAWRYATNEEAAKRRRIWGIGINLLFADFPLFCVEVDIVWSVGFQTGLQALAFIFTILSFTYNALRVWLYLMVRFIKRSQPKNALGGIPTNGTGQTGNPNFPTGQHAAYLGGAQGTLHPYNPEQSVAIQQDYMDESQGPAPIAAALSTAMASEMGQEMHASPHRAGGIIPQSTFQHSHPAPTAAQGVIPIVPNAAAGFTRQPYNTSASHLG